MNLYLPHPPGTKFSPVIYTFLNPCRMKIRKLNGTEILMGYGIGDTIEVMEPIIQYLVCSHKKLKEIPMSDGSAVIEFPNVIPVKRIIE